MGRIDTLTKQYISDSKVFADAFNFFIYGGSPVIRPEELHVMDTAAIAVPFEKNGNSGGNRKAYPVQKYRDILKSLVAMEDKDMVYLILGLEGQSEVHYAMPPRNMLYDALEYARQIEGIATAHREKKDKRYRNSGEFLSGFYKEDQLIPVITLVVYFGPEVWDAPKSLREMFFVRDKRVLQYLGDYKINLIAPSELSDTDFEKFKTDLREVMKYIKYSMDKQKLLELVENDKRFSHVNHKTAILLNECTHSGLKFQNLEGEIDMCQAIKEIRQESKEEGRQEGREEGRQEGRQEGREEGRAQGVLSSIRSLMKNMGLTAEQAMELLDIPFAERSVYQAQI